MEKTKKVSLEKKFNNFKEGSINALKNVGQAGVIIVGGTILGSLLILPFGVVIYPIVTGIEAISKHQEYFKSFLDKDNIQMGLAMYGIGAGSASGTFICNFLKESYWKH